MKKDEIKDQNIDQSKKDIEEQKKKQEELLKKFVEQNTKELVVNTIDSELKNNIERFLKYLESCKIEVEDKKKLFTDQTKNINEKLKKLAKEGKIKFNDEDYKKSEESFIKYQNFLTQVFQELYSEIEFYSNLTKNLPQTIRVLKNVLDDSAVFLKEKLKTSKRHIKKLQKDLRLSFSRYNVSFEDQLKKLDYLNKYLEFVKNKK